MLVLSRRMNQEVFIADRLIKITVVDIQDGCVKLGFDAPKDIDINRGEIQCSKERAALEKGF